MKKNAVGFLGIALALADAVFILIVRGKTVTTAQGMGMLDAALIVVILGLVAAVRGSWFWLILSGAGIVEILFILF